MRRKIACVVAVLASAIAQSGHAQIVIAELSELTIPVNPQNGYGSFTFGDFSVAGAVTTTADSVILDIAVDNDGSNGLFGGVGVDFGIPTTIGAIDLASLAIQALAVAFGVGRSDSG